jgi:DnaJ-class molecular chaperone
MAMESDWRRTDNQKGGIFMVIATDDLELTCPHCEGTGEEKEGTPCPKCGAKGVILTAQGNTLLHFIRKHIDQ